MPSRILPKMLVRTLLIGLVLTPALVAADEADTYSEQSVIDDATDFFGESAEKVGEVISKVFEEQGRPNAIIKGKEASGAFVVGARYGDGTLQVKSGGSRQVFWTGPSVGFDAGGNLSKVYVLIYDLPAIEAIFERFPAVDGSLYFVGGVSANYHQKNNIKLAPIRLGAGLRSGVNVGYMHYTREKTWNPF